MYAVPSSKKIIDVFYNEILPGIVKGNYYIGQMSATIRFNVKINKDGQLKDLEGINDPDLPTMIIKDEEAFNHYLVKLIEEIYDNYVPLKWKESPSYIRDDKNIFSAEKNHLKYYLSHIWANMTYMDFLNPEQYLKRYLSFLTDNTFKHKKIATNPIEKLNGCHLRITNIEQESISETPYAFRIEILDRLPKNVSDERNCQKYALPDIKYGIEDTPNGKMAYIYAIQYDWKAKKANNENPEFSSKIKRLLYKIDEDISKEELAKKGQTQTDNSTIEENVVDVTPAAIISLISVLSLFNQNEINNIIVPTCFPVRWESVRMVNMEELDYYRNEHNYPEEKIKELEAQYDLEQYRDGRNITDKMIRNFRRLAYHFNNLDIVSYPFDFDMDDFMYVRLNECLIPNNSDHMLAQIVGSFNYQKDQKTR